MNKKQKLVLYIFIILLLCIFLLLPCNVQYPKLNKSFFQYRPITFVIINDIEQIPYQQLEESKIGIIPHIFVPMLYVEIIIVLLITISLLLIFKD